MYLNELKKLGVELDKSAMKQITGGYGSNVCRVYSNGSWSGCTTVSHAQTLYNGGWYGTTGYCCASCSSMGSSMCY